jgi:hypothetical protein
MRFLPSLRAIIASPLRSRSEQAEFYEHESPRPGATGRPEAAGNRRLLPL